MKGNIEQKYIFIFKYLWLDY